MLAALDVLPRILIIDDDQSLLESYTVLLEDEFQVSTAESGERGLDSAAARGRASCSARCPLTRHQRYRSLTPHQGVR